jgi:chromosome transmission fidelity protein 1
MLDDLGRLIVNFSRAVPEGIVVFLPSYNYEAHIQRHWEASGVLAALAKHKRVFREPRGAGDTEALLKDYALAIDEVCRDNAIGSCCFAGVYCLPLVLLPHFTLPT